MIASHFHTSYRAAALAVALVLAGLSAGAWSVQSPTPAHAAMAATAPSLVAPADQISDFQARLALARLLSQAGSLEEASELFRILLADQPDQPALLRMEWAMVLARQGQGQAADQQARLALAADGGDPQVLMSAADLAASMGHAQACGQYYSQALRLLPPGQERQEAELRLGAAANLWGDFNLVERTYRQALRANPDDPSLALRLSEALISAQRYEEAEQELRLLLLARPNLSEALAALADLKTRDGDLQASIQWCEALLAQEPANPGALSLRAQNLLRLGRVEQAEAAYRTMIERTGPTAPALVGLGRIALARGRDDMARELFQKAAQSDPRSVEAEFWNVGGERAIQSDFLEQLTAPGIKQPLILVGWAEMYAKLGLRDQAIACCLAALRQDERCFPARMNLAELLASSHRYQEALRELERLGAQTPDNRKVMLTRARALSWSKAYDESLNEYDRVARLNPADPLPVMEAARVAAWANMFERSRQTYGRLAQPALDDRLAAVLSGLAETRQGPDRQALSRLRAVCQPSDGYHGYEKVERLKEQADLTPEARRELEKSLLSLLGAYRLQKSASLESQAKSLVWDKRLTRGQDVYLELVAFRPGNQEAWFDLGQVQCALGMCDQEKATYQQLLVLDPLHNLAPQALERQEIRANPALQGAYSYWHERGRGQLAQMTRARADLGLSVPLLGRINAHLIGHHWLESPREFGSSAEATGFTLGLEGQLTPNLTAGVNWTHKDYQRSDLADRDNGRAEAWYNLGDYLKLGAGFTREDHLSNAFALAQGLQRDTWWLGLKSDLTRAWSLEGRLSQLDYSDGNHGRHHYLLLGRTLTDYPRIFKVSLRADYRDTDRAEQYVYQGARLIDIVHPYWSPRDNLAGAVVIEWRHDLAKQLYCGAEQHYYHLRLNLGTDTANNPTAAWDAKWHYQFAGHWAVEVQGLVNRSREWDAEGLWLNLRYSF